MIAARNGGNSTSYVDFDNFSLTLVQPAACGAHASGSTYTLQTSQTAGSIPVTATQCTYGGVQPTQTTVSQSYSCANGVQTAQGAPVSVVADTGAPVCNPAPVNGSCGASNGATLAAIPNTGLCGTGIASSVTGSGPWSWSCVGSNGGTTAACTAARFTATLTPVALSSTTIYPTDTLLMTSNLSGGQMSTANVVVQTLIQNQNGSTVSTLSQNITATGAAVPVSFQYTVPDNNTLPAGTYQISQGFLEAGTFKAVSTASFTVPAAAITLNEAFDDGRTSLNTNVWNTFENVNVLYEGVQSIDTPDAVQTIPNQGLRLRADKRSLEGQAYTTGEITTLTHFSQTYGHFEMRAQIPGGAGIYPSFWMLPVDYTIGTDEGEVDIFEHIGIQPDMMLQTLHFPGGGAQSFQCMSKTDWSLAYHVYGLDWKPGSITWLIDGVPCSTQTANIPNGPMYLIAGLAVGGPQTWGGAPNAATIFPAYMDISYIKAWQYPDVPAGPVPAMQFAGSITITPPNPKAGDLITISGSITAGSKALTGVTEGFVAYQESPYITYYGQRSAPAINIPANSTGQYKVTYQLPANMPPGLYNFYVQAMASNSPAIQLLNAQELMIGTPLAPLP